VRVPVTKILGTRDGIAELEKSEQTRHNLPGATRWALIEGGNHCQFSFYGFQPGDSTATISRDRQQELTLQLVVETLEAASRAMGVAPANQRGAVVRIQSAPSTSLCSREN